MSKIGEKKIKVPENISIQVQGPQISVKGMEGELYFDIPKDLKVEVKDSEIKVVRLSDKKRVKAFHGLYRSLIHNAVEGVNKPWEKRLEVVGTGYRVKQQGENLIFEVGYSHPVIFEKVEGVSLSVEGKNKVVVKGIDKQLVGQVAYRIKSIKKPDPYKGKGVRYEGEQIKLKPGKKAKGAVGA